MLHVGITASRDGLTTAQHIELTTWLTVLRRAGAHAFHHGDCVGGDEQGAKIARELGYRVVGHPPTKDVLRAWFASDETREPRDYHDRNKDIVSESGVLFACPASATNRRGGTWWTIGYAAQMAKMYAPEARRPVIVLGPDGRVIR